MIENSQAPFSKVAVKLSCKFEQNFPKNIPQAVKLF